MTSDYCAVHGKEPIPESYYVLCTECGHCYVTEEELIQRDLEVRRSISRESMHIIGVPYDTNPEPARSGEQIRTCPECTHDF